MEYAVRFHGAFNQVINLLLRQWLTQNLLPGPHVPGATPRNKWTRRLNRLNTLLVRRRKHEGIELLQLLLARRKRGTASPRSGHGDRSERNIWRFTHFERLNLGGFSVAILELEGGTVNHVGESVVADLDVFRCGAHRSRFRFGDVRKPKRRVRLLVDGGVSWVFAGGLGCLAGIVGGGVGREGESELRGWVRIRVRVEWWREDGETSGELQSHGEEDNQLPISQLSYRGKCENVVVLS